jgi:hypothetical protein
MFDVNCAWTLNEARTRSEALKELSLNRLEEPVWPPENYDGLAQLRRTCGIPIAAGENVPALMDFERLMAAQAADFVQPSPHAWKPDAAGALKANEESLAIVRKLAAVLGPGDVEAQTDQIASNFKVAQATKDAEQRKAALDDALNIVKALDAKGLLSADQKSWQAMIEAELAK